MEPVNLKNLRCGYRAKVEKVLRPVLSLTKISWLSHIAQKLRDTKDKIPSVWPKPQEALDSVGYVMKCVTR